MRLSWQRVGEVFFCWGNQQNNGGCQALVDSCRHPPPTNPPKTAPKKPWSSRPSQWLLLHLQGLKMPCDDQFESTSPRCNCHDSTHLEGLYGKRMRKKICILELCWTRVFRVYNIYDISITVFVWILWSSFSIPPTKTKQNCIPISVFWVLTEAEQFLSRPVSVQKKRPWKPHWWRRTLEKDGKRTHPFFKSLYFNKKNKNNTSIKTSLHHLQPNYLFSASSSWWFAKSQRDTRSVLTAWPSEPGRSVWRIGSDPPFDCCSGGKTPGEQKDLSKTYRTLDMYVDICEIYTFGNI